MPNNDSTTFVCKVRLVGKTGKTKLHPYNCTTSEMSCKLVAQDGVIFKVPRFQLDCNQRHKNTFMLHKLVLKFVFAELQQLLLHWHDHWNLISLCIPKSNRKSPSYCENKIPTHPRVIVIATVFVFVLGANLLMRRGGMGSVPPFYGTPKFYNGLIYWQN